MAQKKQRPISRSIILCTALLSVLLCVSCIDNTFDLRWEHDPRGLYSAHFSDNADLLLIASVGGSAELWSFKTNIHLKSWTLNTGEHSDLAHVALSLNGQVAVAANHFNIGVWDTQSGQNIGYWKMPNYITQISVSESGQYALVASNNHSVQLVDLRSGIRVWEARHAAYIQAIALSEDGRYGVVGCDDNSTTLWDIRQNKRLHLWEENTRIRFVAISPNNQYVLTSAPYQSIKIWDIATGQLKYELQTFSGFLKYFSRQTINVSSAHFSDDESYLVTGAPPGKIMLWDLNSGGLKQAWSIPKPNFWKPTATLIYAAMISDDNKYVYAETSSGHGYTWTITNP